MSKSNGICRSGCEVTVSCCSALRPGRRAVVGAPESPGFAKTQDCAVRHRRRQHNPVDKAAKVNNIR